jgi:hypothetical protein
MNSKENWQPLSLLTSQFAANVDALAARDADLAQQLRALPATTQLFSTATGQLRLADQAGNETADIAPPAASRQVITKVYPTGQCTCPVLIAGLGYGWLWQQLYTLPISTPALPGHRPPLYFMCGDVAELHTVLHLHDWRAMLADPRVRLFVGPDSFAQLEGSLTTDSRLPWPKLSVTLDKTCWPAGKDFDGLVQSLFADGAKRIGELKQRSSASTDLIAQKLAAGKPLRVLGVTSRYTTFLQHSMRDWLDAFERMGHTTKLVLEQSDHQAFNSIGHAEACAAFQPDLIVLIDHYRAEFNAFPDDVPCVMWVQDSLPNIFSPAAGAAQTNFDFCIGSGRLLLTTRHGYPAERFLTAPVTVNESRFAPRELSASAIEKYGCDVSFVSHASMPADAIVQEQLSNTTEASSRKLIADVYDRLRAIYDAGGCISHPLRMRALVDQSARSLNLALDAAQVPALISFLTQRVNNALFRHQSLLWLAGLGLDVRLYGRGWEEHPHLSRFARGQADNAAELCTIYQASRINLQVTPHGAVHQRLFEGVAAGAFFLLRAQPVDEVDALYRPLAAWCEREAIADDADLRRRATPEVLSLLKQFQRMTLLDPFELEFPLTHEIRLSADSGFTLAAAGAIPEYESVAFDSFRELRAKVTHYLAHPEERTRIAASMRQRVLERYTYTGVTKQLLSMIAKGLRPPTTQAIAEAA